MFRRGFKTWCENVALQQRRELGLRPLDPLSPEALAGHLGIQVWRIEQIPGLSKESVDILLREDPDSWSAATVCVDSKQAIVLNSTHSGGRPASNLAHELSHVLLSHTPARVDVLADGVLMLNNYDRKQEEEAAWLAGCLLLPRQALYSIRQHQLTPHQAAIRYGVSRDMLQYRMGVTGINKQFGRV